MKDDVICVARYRQVGHGTIGRENSSFARFASRSNRLSRLARPRTSNSNMIFFEHPPSPSTLLLVQGSRFSDLKVQSDQRSMTRFKVGEENRSACRSYTKVSADHQRSGLFFALRQRFNVKGLM